MRCMLVFLVLGVGLCLAPAACSQEEAHALVRKAIQAMGGEDQLSQIHAVHSNIKGVLHEVEGATFTGEVFKQDPDRLKYTLRTEVSGVVLGMVMVVNGPNIWTKVNEQVEPSSEHTRKSMQRSLQVDQVTSLLPLLREKRFTLSPLGESQKEGRAVLGLKVAAEGQPDVLLFFDKADGFLLRAEYRGIDDNTGKEVDSAVTYADYKALDPTAPEEALLKTAKVGSGGAELLEYLRKRTPSDAVRTRLAGLVRRLGSEVFAEREEASRELVAAGSIAVPFLQQAAKSTDIEVAQRAKDCLERVKGEQEAGVTNAALRLLALRKPPGAAEVLLAFAPTAADPALAREVHFALAAVARKEGKPDEVLVKALEDKDPVRRAAAQAALGKDGSNLAQQPGRRLFIPGLKLATKATEYRNGKKMMEWQRVEVRFFNKFEDAVFAKP